MAKIQQHDGSKARNRLRRILFAFIVVLVISFVPLMPHMPSCTDNTTPTRLGSIFLSKIYQREFVNGLEIHEIDYVAIGSVVFLRFWDWLDTEDWVMNVSNKSILNLVNPSWGADEAELPEHVNNLVAESRARHDGRVENTCELVRAVAVEGW